jgi:hypothetical protein
VPPKWRKLIFAARAADRRLYETAVLATLRDPLRSSDIWVVGSRDYRAFEDYLHKHPLAAIWDDGSTASSDGQYFSAAGRGGAGGAVNALLGSNSRRGSGI